MAEAMAIGGKALGAGGSIFGGIQQKKAAYAEADQLDINADRTDDNAGLVRAMSQRDAMEQRRQARLLNSRALAVAAASGGGADDPTVVNQMAAIDGEGEYRALSSLYEGETQGRNYEADADAIRAQAKATRKAGKNAKIAGFINGAASLLGAGSTMADRYGSTSKGG